MTELQQEENISESCESENIDNLLFDNTSDFENPNITSLPSNTHIPDTASIPFRAGDLPAVATIPFRADRTTIANIPFRADGLSSNIDSVPSNTHIPDTASIPFRAGDLPAVATIPFRADRTTIANIPFRADGLSSNIDSVPSNTHIPDTASIPFRAGDLPAVATIPFRADSSNSFNIPFTTKVNSDTNQGGFLNDAECDNNSDFLTDVETENVSDFKADTLVVDFDSDSSFFPENEIPENFNDKKKRFKVCDF